MVQKSESQSTKKENQGTKDRKSKYKQERIRVQKTESQSTCKQERIRVQKSESQSTNKKDLWYKNEKSSYTSQNNHSSLTIRQ